MHVYLLSGLMRCGVCGRKMQASWNNGRAYYSCKFPAEYAVSEERDSKSVYVRESPISPGLDQGIGQLFDDDHIDATCAALAEASHTDADHDADRDLMLRQQLRGCDARLAEYRNLLEQQPDISTIGTWIAEVERERKRLHRQLGQKPTDRPLTSAEVGALVTSQRDIVRVLAHANTRTGEAIYDELGIALTCDPVTTSILVSAGAPHVLRVCVGGGT